MQRNLGGGSSRDEKKKKNKKRRGEREKKKEEGEEAYENSIGPRFEVERRVRVRGEGRGSWKVSKREHRQLVDL